VILGTAAYMSPEQARGYSVDKRADIWAFACVLYEMLTGRTAFGRETVTDTLAALVERDADWSRLPAGTPSAMRRMLRRCLEKDVNRRLRDIGDARVDLEEDEPTTENAAPRRRPLELAGWAAAGLSLLLTAAMARTSWSSGGAEAGAPRLSHAIRLTETPEPEWGPAISPDGKWVAYIANANGRSDVWVKFLQTGAVLNITGSLPLEVQVRRGQGSVEIHPDGSVIAFTARERSPTGTYDTWIVPAPIGGAPRKLLSARTALRWSPDGKRLAAVSAGGGRGDGLIVANSDGTGERDLVPIEGGRHLHSPAWSSDGKFVYFIYTYDSWNDEPSEIYRVSAEGGKPEPLVQTIRRAVFPAPLPDLKGLIYAANPDSVDLGLWWEPIGGGTPRSLTIGIGELSEPRVSADGHRLVARLTESRRPLMFVPVRFDRPPEVRAITDGYTGDLDPSLDPPSNRLVFSSSRSGNRNLWLAKGDGSNAVPLTSERFIDERPSFSADGKQVAFVSDRDGQRGVWVIAADGGTPRSIGPATVLGSLSWMPDGTRLMFATPGDSLPKLATIAVATGRVDPFATTGGATAPVWSAVTRRLAYIEPTQTVPVRQRIRFANEAGEQIFAAFPSDSVTFNNAVLAWSPDGKRLAALNVVGNGGTSLWIAEPEGRYPLRKLLELPTSVLPRGMTWSADGSGVVIAYQDSTSDIVLFDLSHP
jgi:Tol biopolymer transport system component